MPVGSHLYQVAEELTGGLYCSAGAFATTDKCDSLDPLSALDDPTAKRMREGSEAVAPRNR